MPGRLCFLTVAGGTAFSTLTGSSMANTAMLGSLMVPGEMERRGYHWKMSLGPILGTGGLAMIIPPSTLGVLLASLAEIDVGRFLIAGILPRAGAGPALHRHDRPAVWRNPSRCASYETERLNFSQAVATVIVNIVPMGRWC
ncbi:MAG: TRAP transporter large permease subunit [Burkholderiaceae bacterium]